VLAVTKFFPAESISMVYLTLLVSVACFGSDQLRVSTTLLESVGAGAIVVVDADRTGAVPLLYTGRPSTLSQAARNMEIPVMARKYLKIDRI